MAYFETIGYFITNKAIFHILEHGVFWNMEYFRIWNILEYGIFWNMEYLSIRYIPYFKTKQYLDIHKTYLPYFRIWKMEYFGIWNVLEYGIF